jgi:hypothetical protein
VGGGFQATQTEFEVQIAQFAAETDIPGHIIANFEPQNEK